MRPEVRSWVKEQVERLKPEPLVIEVGSYNVNGTVRDLFPEPYVGIDSRPGPGVDRVIDIVEGGDWLAGKAKTVVCCEALEHMSRPWVALEKMRKALEPGGLFIATWCFDFPIHNEPSDFFRVTPAGFEVLLAWAGFSYVEIHQEGGTPEKPVGIFAIARRPN